MKTGFSNILDWFDLENYDNSREYDAIDWVSQLQNRIWLYEIVTEPNWSAFGSEGWEFLSEIAPGFKSFFGLSPASREHTDYDDIALLEIEKELDSNVQLLTLSDVVSSYDSMISRNDGLFLAKVRFEIDQYELDPDLESSGFEYLNKSYDEMWYEENDYHCGEIFLKVDLRTPNSRLKSEFGRVLDVARKKFLTPDSPFFEANKKLKGLSPLLLLEKSILPLIDILIWEKVENLSRNDYLRKQIVFHQDENFRSYDEYHSWVEKSLDRRYIRAFWESYKEEAIRERLRKRQREKAKS